MSAGAATGRMLLTQPLFHALDCRRAGGCYIFGMRRWHFFIWLMIVLSSPSVFPAQEGVRSASIVIEVKDATGAVIPKARVLILPLPNADGGMLGTDENGRVSLALPSGIYTLRVQMLGFRPVKRRIQAEPGTHQTIPIQLTLGTCPQCVEVLCAGTGCPPTPSFPEQSHVASLDGRYLLLRRGWPWAGRHTVELEDRVLKTRRKLFQYDRRVVFLWYGKLIIATDYAGRRASHCTLYSVDKKTPSVQVLDLLLSQLDEDERRGLVEVLSNRRVYVEALGFGFNGMAEWGPGLGAKLSAYGPEGTLEFQWIYGVGLPADQTILSTAYRSSRVPSP